MESVPTLKVKSFNNILLKKFNCRGNNNFMALTEYVNTENLRLQLKLDLKNIIKMTYTRIRLH